MTLILPGFDAEAARGLEQKVADSHSFGDVP